MPFTPPTGYPYSDDSSPGANDGDVVFAEHVNSIMEYLEDVLPGEILDATGVALSDATPEDLGTPAPGVATTASRADHVHDLPTPAEIGAATQANIDTSIAAHVAATDPHGDRAYTDAAIAALTPTQIYRGTINASTNPNYPEADRDDVYRVIAAGRVGGASGVEVEIGDLILCLVDDSPAGNQATVGANWTVIQGNLNGVVIGPNTVTNDRIAVFDGTTGKIIKQAGVTVGQLDNYTPTDTNDWPGVDPVTQTEGLNFLAARTTDLEASVTGLSGDTRLIQILVTDPQGAALSTGDGKAFVVIPATLNGYILTGVMAAVTTASTSGNPTIQLARVRSGTAVDMLSTRITIDANEATSTTAATAAVINTANDDLATADFIRVDLDVAGTGTRGLIVSLTLEAP